MVVVVALGTMLVADRGPVPWELAKPPGALFQLLFTHDVPCVAFVVETVLTLVLCVHKAGRLEYLAGGHLLAAAQFPHSSTT